MPRRARQLAAVCTIVTSWSLCQKGGLVTLEARRSLVLSSQVVLSSAMMVLAVTGEEIDAFSVVKDLMAFFILALGSLL